MGAIRILDYLDERAVLFLTAKNRTEVLNAAVEKAAELSYIEDVGSFRDAVVARDKVLSTGIGFGVAVPHAKRPGISGFFVIPVILQDPVDWDASDREPVQIAFLIGGPDDQQQQYLQILAKIVLVTKNPELRKRLIAATSASDVVALFQDV